ncbi:hypothetical protein B2J93_8084 [Marssonina coronariae]|uniref:Uncharacterized protein n=1 Tax=Diplocarpon coronariae TaxID=2795749 RepID=A0A218ZC66_9HELO|nr:hypothetical protein B2J93_8084 [Marssonina coronariae]
MTPGCAKQAERAERNSNTPPDSQEFRQASHDSAAETQGDERRSVSRLSFTTRTHLFENMGQQRTRSEWLLSEASSTTRLELRGCGHGGTSDEALYLPCTAGEYDHPGWIETSGPRIVEPSRQVEVIPSDNPRRHHSEGSPSFDGQTRSRFFAEEDRERMGCLAWWQTLSRPASLMHGAAG